MIWFNKSLQASDLQSLGSGNMGGFLEIICTEVGDNYMKATMPVNEKTKQPYGLLHGGASVALAETIGSVASAMVVDHSKFYCVGMEINANHIRSAKDGLVTALCTPLHLGSTTHVWDIKISDEKEKLVCVSRLTVAIIKRKDSRIL